MLKSLSITVAIAFVSVSLGCWAKHEIPAVSEPVYVLIPPFFDPKLPPGENQCLFQRFLFPKFHLPATVDVCKGAQLANDDSLIFISVKDDRSITINGEKVGRLADTRELVRRLSTIFESRSKNGVFEPGSNRIVKAVGLQIPAEASFGDLMTVAQAVKESGADPIVLLLDGRLPGMRPERIR